MCFQLRIVATDKKMHCVSLCFQLRTVAKSLGRSMVARSLPWSWSLWNGWRMWSPRSPRQWKKPRKWGVGLNGVKKTQMLADANSDILLALNSSLFLWHINWIIGSWGWMMEDPALSSETRRMHDLKVSSLNKHWRIEQLLNART